MSITVIQQHVFVRWGGSCGSGCGGGGSGGGGGKSLYWAHVLSLPKLEVFINLHDLMHAEGMHTQEQQNGNLNIKNICTHSNKNLLRDRTFFHGFKHSRLDWEHGLCSTKKIIIWTEDIFLASRQRQRDNIKELKGQAIIRKMTRSRCLNEVASTNTHRHTAIGNSCMAWKHGHFVAAVLSLAQLCI